MSQRIKILIIEDNPNDAEMVVRELRRAGFEPDWQRVETEPDFLAGIKTQPEIILSDFSMPRFSGLRAAELLQQSGLNIPFILISGTVGEEVAVEAMKHGATDYLIKDRIARLGPAVRRAIKEVADRIERKRLEQQFIEAQKMDVLGQLAAGVAHDFNNILNVIIGYSELMMPEVAAESVPRKCAEEIRHAAERATALTRQLLTFSRKQTVQAVVLDLNEVVRDMDKMLRRVVDENVDLTILLEKEIGRIKADGDQIGQVLMNLVVNARDAMPNGGRLLVETRNAVLEESHVSAHKGVLPGDYVMLAVSDTGTGMSNEVKARLFEPFFTTKPKGKGTGLGLATCMTIAKQCDGHICVASTPGEGTTFKLYFPRVSQPVVIVAQPVQAGKPSRGTETVLLVEDEPSVRLLACRILTSQGYEVLSANNGQEGLRVAGERKDKPIRLVITDLVMPQMGGKAMAERLTAIYPDIKILFTSGYIDEANSRRGVPGLERMLLQKPYSPVMLSRKVRELLDEK